MLLLNTQKQPALYMLVLAKKKTKNKELIDNV